MCKNERNKIYEKYGFVYELVFLQSRAGTCPRDVVEAAASLCAHYSKAKQVYAP